MSDAAEAPAQKWRPLERIERRVAGVLIEKAKTTPDAYPLTLNSLKNGANQKSNRFPQMELDEEQISDAAEALAQSHAIARVQSDSRAEKYRHLMYDWLGVDKVELAVMGELLLRGAQTLGELRARAARMEPIPDQRALQPVVDSLHDKGLLTYLTPPGRGCVVTHNLYQQQEIAKLRTEHGGYTDPACGHGGPAPAAAPSTPATPATSQPVTPAPAPTPAAPPAAAAPPAPAAVDNALADTIAALRGELADLREEFETTTGALRSELEDLKSQLGV
ncbi:MAG: hypothetical protein CMJ58_10665 [Planctomycetaceae bacterium]|nr:hypothetical protein [Planctomycetaceae bacterium]